MKFNVHYEPLALGDATQLFVEKVVNFFKFSPRGFDIKIYDRKTFVLLGSLELLNCS